MKKVGLISVILVMGIANSANAFALQPISYDMQNGDADNGRFRYLDENYTGSGNVNQGYAQLSGGLGDLTDGIIATENWNIVEAPPGNGPYVGWLQIDPTITFNFASTVNIDSVTIHVDDSNNFGGVRVPESVEINMGSNSFNSAQLIDRTSSAPTSYTFSNLGFTGNSLDLTLNRRQSTSWVFLSEVEFDGASTPVPEPLTILGSFTAVGFGALFKRKKCS